MKKEESQFFQFAGSVCKMLASSNCICLLLLPVICKEVIGKRDTFFKKLLKTSDPEYTNLFTPLITPIPKTLKSTIECASYATWSSQLTVKSERASAFVFANDTCTLGKTPVFLDDFKNRGPIFSGEEGVHVMDGIKTTSAEAHAGMFAYILFNEERQFHEHRHKNLIQPPNPAKWNPNNDPFGYVLDSPVQTFGGSKAVKFGGGAYLEYPIASKQWSKITVLVWYNPGAVIPQGEPLFVLDNPKSLGNSGFEVWAGGSWSAFNPRVGNMRAGIFGEAITGIPGITIQGAFSPDNVIESNTWSYLGYAFDGDAGKFAFYINGTRIGNEHYRSDYVSKLSNMGEITIGKYGTNTLDHHLASMEVYETFLDEPDVEDYFVRSITTRVNPE